MAARACRAIVRPVPLPTDALLQRVKTAEVRHIAVQTNINWGPSNGVGDAQSNGGGYMALMNQTGLLSYTGGQEWCRSVPRLQGFPWADVRIHRQLGLSGSHAKISIPFRY
jgi:hypothetical protein